MSGPAFFYAPQLQAYDFGPHHPLRPERLSRTRSLLLEKGLLLPGEEKEPEPAQEEDLLLVHTAEYIRAVKAAVPDPSRGLGTGDNPVFRGMHEAAALITGGSIQAAVLAVEGKASPAANLAGGLHHALPDRASGFCIYNDPAVAIARVKKDYGLKVAYLDIDAHHGDGVQAVFYEDPSVLTVSLHESGRYLFPGTGFPEEVGRGRGRGYALNLPLLPGTRDDSFLECLELALQAVEAFRPDLLVLQSGVDGHRLDPLAHLEYTTRGYRRGMELLRRFAGVLVGG
jgi:acetoin utilization protein AcuC